MIAVYALIAIAVLAAIAYLYIKYKKKRTEIAKIKKKRKEKDDAAIDDISLTDAGRDAVIEKNKQEEEDEQNKLKAGKK